jgi:hypothetical protein
MPLTAKPFSRLTCSVLFLPLPHLLLLLLLSCETSSRRPSCHGPLDFLDSQQSTFYQTFLHPINLLVTAFSTTSISVDSTLLLTAVNTLFIDQCNFQHVFLLIFHLH